MEREIYQNPTVKKVVFQIRFPSLFSIEKKIGDFQLEIMDQFPNSSLTLRRQILVADIGSNLKIEETDINSPDIIEKIWHFKSPKGVDVNVTSNSLDITSKHHKTYDQGDTDKFRDVIELVVESFIKIIKIPIISRIGIRYIDECPVFSNDNDEFNEWYNTSFPLGRFDLQDIVNIDFNVIVVKDKHRLIYKESLKRTDNNISLILDFDGFGTQINVKDYLSVTDDLHKIIHDEYQKTIKEPLREYMRKGA